MADETTEIHVKVILKNLPVLKTKIALENTRLWDVLVAEGFFSLSEKREIQKIYPGELGQVEQILNYFTQKDWKAFLRFCDILKLPSIGQGHIVKNYLSEAFECPSSSCNQKSQDAGDCAVASSHAQSTESHAGTAASVRADSAEELFFFSASNMEDNWAYRKYRYVIDLTLERLGDGKQCAIHIAVIDSGINTDLPVFQGFKIDVYNCTETNHPPTESEKQHGTCVLSLICAYLEDVKKHVKIHFCQIGSSNNRDIFFNRVATAYSKILDLGTACIICQSNGVLKPPSKATGLKTKLNSLLETNVLICAASNAGAWSADTIAWPAKDSIAVGSINKDGKPAESSPQGRELHIMAPGHRIDVANAKYASWKEDEAKYTEKSGTSFAAPFVVAMYAHILLQIDSTLTDLSPEKKQLLLTHGVARELLMFLAEGVGHTKERGHGVLLSSKNVLDTDEGLKTTVKNALENAGEHY